MACQLQSTSLCERLPPPRPIGAAVRGPTGRLPPLRPRLPPPAHPSSTRVSRRLSCSARRARLSQCGTAKAPPRDVAPITDTSGATAAITTSSAVAGGAVKLRGSAGPPFHGLGRASGGARAGVDCSFAAISSGANSECDCAVVALVAPSHLAPPARALKLSSTPGTCRPRVESNLIGARALQFRRRGARGAVSIEVLAMFSLLTALSHFAASPPSPPSPPRLISRSSSLASRRWLHGRRCRSNRRSSRWCSSRWCSSRSSSRRRCRCRGARSSRHARLILCACVWWRVCVRRRHQLLASSI